MRLPASDFGATVVDPPVHERESWPQWFFRTLRQTANPNTMHTEDLTPVELEKQASFESLDYYKPYPDMYVEYLRESHRNRRHRYLSSFSTDSSGGPPQTAEVEVEVTVEGSNGLPPVPSPSRTGLISSLSVPSPIQQVTEALPILQMDKEERHAALRWLLHVLIAFSVGIVATFVSYAVDLMEKYRADTLHEVMTRGGRHSVVNNAAGFLYNVIGSVLLMVVAAGVVVYYEPAASGGGIPDVMAYLNGVHLRKAMNLRTFLAKVVSCICAVAGGLPVGLEAPLIHLGAITGAGMTQGRSRTLGFQTRLFQAFRNNKDRRDFITAGAACGVSVAFGAPIGGLLFVMEEVSSFWDQSSNGQIFLATMLCFTFSTIINSIVEDRRFLGWVSNAASVLFEVNLTIPLNLISIVPSLLLGLIIGSMAAFFTKANLILIKWRRRVLRPYPFRRFLEPVVLGAVFSACMYAMSLVAPCVEEREIIDVNNTVHIWGTEVAGRLFNSTCAKPNTYSPLGTLNMASGKNTIRHLFSRQTAGEFTVVNLVLYFFIYFCFAVLCSGTAVAGGLVVPSLVMGAVFGRLYGLMLFKMGAKEVPGIPHGYPTSDAWMDPGVFALIGAGAFLAGTSRMTMAICVIMVELSSELHYLLPVMVAIVMSKSTADWLCEPLYHQMLMMDSVPYLPHNIVKPEFEQLTAADVMASEVVMLRMRERTETVLAALRDSTHHAFPVVEAELDDLLKEEAQHTRNDEGNGSTSGWGETTNHKNNNNSSVANSSGRRGVLGSSFPSQHTTTAKPSETHSLDDPTVRIRYKFVGLVTREDLQVYFTLPQLKEYDAEAVTSSPVPLTADDSDGFGGRLAPCVLAIRRLSWQQWMAQKSKLFFSTSDRYEWVRTHIPDGAPSGVDVGAESASFIGENRLPPVVDLSLIVNRSPWVIPPFFNLQMAYHTFRMMGLRHMVVVDGDTVTGMITRKDLLVDSLRRRMKELSARLATADSAAPSLPASHTNRSHPLTRHPTPPPPPQQPQQQKRDEKKEKKPENAVREADYFHGPEINILRQRSLVEGGEEYGEERQRHGGQHAHAHTNAMVWRQQQQQWQMKNGNGERAPPLDEDAALSPVAFVAAAASCERQERTTTSLPRTDEGEVEDGHNGSRKTTSPLSALFGTSPTNVVKVVGPGRAVGVGGAAAPLLFTPPPRVLTKSTSPSLPTGDTGKDAVTSQVKSAERSLPPDVEMAFDLSVLKASRDALRN